MKQVIIIATLCCLCFSCKKDNIYVSFTEKQLVFLNYQKGQTLKFIDTASITHTLQQSEYARQYREEVGMFGQTGFFSEEYKVAYNSQSGLDLHIHLNTKQNPPLTLEFASYAAHVVPDSIDVAFPSLKVNGKNYNQVYRLKMYKYGELLNTTDTGTLFHNREYGVIQMIFPNGKKIVKTD